MTLLFSKGKLAVTNKWLQKSRISYLMHFTIQAAEGDFVPSASAYAFGRRPNFFK